MSGSFTSLPNNSNFSFYDKYRNSYKLFNFQLFHKAAFSIWSKLGKKTLNKQYIILFSEYQKISFFATFCMSTQNDGTTTNYELSNYAEFNDVKQLNEHIASNKITDLCCCYSEKMPDNLDGIEIKHDVKIDNVYNTELHAARPILNLIIREGQFLITSAITVIVGSDQSDKPIFKELPTKWNELLGDAINGVDGDGVVVTLNVLFDGFGNIILQAKTSDKKFDLPLIAKTASVPKKKGAVKAAGSILASIEGKPSSNPNNAQANKNETVAINILKNKLRCEKHLKSLNNENIEHITKLNTADRKQLLDIVTRALDADAFYFDTCVWLLGKWHHLIHWIVDYCKENKRQHIVQSSVRNELNYIKDKTIKHAYKSEQGTDLISAAIEALELIGRIANGSNKEPSYVDGFSHEEIDHTKKGYADKAIAIETASHYECHKKVLIISNDTGVSSEVTGKVNEYIEKMYAKHRSKYTVDNDNFPCIVTAWELQQVLNLKDRLQKLINERNNNIIIS